MIYPKTVQIENARLKTLMEKKGDLIMIGRTKSQEIEKVEKEMEEINTKLMEEEAKVDIQDLNKKQMAIVDEVNKHIIAMEEIKAEIYERMIKEVPQELRDRYDELKKKKEELETDRNKVAIKAQKFNDKIIPLAREMMKPFLTDQYEDYDSLAVEDGMIVASIFSHMNDFKNNFKKK
jgi:sugar-specific transcriptional regulator TrmB